ncbi:MAG: DUF4105 domain-containing protein [Saprospiraceae bacterium]|nr:DUF4105 domain-containing protein [Saprospiraceae bacterium]
MKLYPSLVLLILLFTTNSFGQANLEELENTKISILTCRSGNELYSTFGHTAIRVQNIKSRMDMVYNYGVFSFNTPFFYVKFMRGQLPYFLVGYKMDSFLREYNFDKRSVFEQELILTNEQKRDILTYLVENAKPENREYKYDFFYDNCATRVVDVFELSGDVTYSLPIEQKTFRDLLKENLQSLVWSDFGIDMVIGARADRLTNRRHQMFLPEYVMDNLKNAKLADNSALAKSPQLILDFESLNAERKERSINWPFWLMMALLLATVLSNLYFLKSATIVNNTLLISAGILGFFLLFMWFGTNHGATRDNWNVLWLNPIFLVYLFSKTNIKKFLTYLLYGLLIISGANCVINFLPQFFNLAFLPWILSLGIAVYMIQKKRITPTAT